MNANTPMLLMLLTQAVLFVHVIAFALCVSAVLLEDWRLLASRRINAPRLARTARRLTFGLGVLWCSGLGLVALDIAASPGPWAPSAKLVAKLAVVTLLTLNGAALHQWVFPRIAGMTVRIEDQPWWAVATGAVSSASWLYAAFLGVARLVAPWLSLAGFVLLYAAAVGTAVAVALYVTGAARRRWRWA